MQENQILFTDKEDAQVYKTGLMNDPDLIYRLKDSGAVFSGEIIEQMSPFLSFLLSWVLPIVIFIGLGQWMLRLSRAKIAAVTIAAGVHDIGKVGVPDSVLLKEGPLDDHEYDVIKHHPGIGADVLLKIHGYERIAAGVWHHHERWDGTGYPDGQSGENIPLYSRMIALCDSIDAMRSSRSYRKGMTDFDCRREIEENAGTMYDPKLVSLCLSNWDFLTGDLYVNT